MAKFKLTVTDQDGTKHEHDFEAKDKESAELYGRNLAAFGGFDVESEDVVVKVTGKR